MGQAMDGPTDTSANLRSMISFGSPNSPDLRIIASAPDRFTQLPAGRMMALMSGNPDVESILAWRFHARPIGQGGRLESTAFVGGLVPLDSERGGIATSPAALVSLASGYASRSHYFWAGATYVHHWSATAINSVR